MPSQITYTKLAFRHGEVFFVYMHSATVLAVTTTPVRGPETELESHSKMREEERTIPWSIEWPGVSPNITPVYQSVIKLSHCISGVRLSRSSAFHAARDRSLLLSHKQQDLVWCATSISLEWVMQQAAGESCKTYSLFRTESYDLGLLTGALNCNVVSLELSLFPSDPRSSTNHPLIHVLIQQTFCNIRIFEIWGVFLNLMWTEYYGKATCRFQDIFCS